MLVKQLEKALKAISYPVLVALIICASLFSAQFYQTQIEKEAVVVAQAAEAKFEPFDDATTFFSLSEGELVSAQATKKDWVKVKRSDGRSGWVKQQDIELL